MQPFTDGTCSSTFVWSFRGEGLELPEVKTRLGSERSDHLYWRRQTRGRDLWAAQRWWPLPWASHARAHVRAPGLAWKSRSGLGLPLTSPRAASFLVQAENWDGPPQHFLGSQSVFFSFSLSLSESPVADVSRSRTDSAEGRVSFSLFSMNIFEQLQGRCRNWEFLLFFIDFLKIQTYFYWPVTHIS